MMKRTLKGIGIVLIYGAIMLMTFPFSPLHGQCEMLLWEDNFDGTELDSSKWDIQLDNSGGGNDELQYYTPRDTNVYVEDGRLIIRALEEAYEGFSYTSGKLTTEGLADWRYGRIEASIKMPAGQGIWPAFWMLPTEKKYGGWPNSGEIDIVELVGHDTNTVYGTLHYGPPWNFTNGEYSLDDGYFSDAAHVYAIEWFPDSIKWYVDDVLYSKKTADSLRRPEQWQIFRERFYVILNLAVGGNWPGDPDETTQFPQTMEVDYVRVYGDPALQEIIAIDSAYANAAGVRYSFSDIPGASFTWTVPSGAVIVSGQGTSSITVDWGCTPGEVTLDVTDLACTDQSYRYLVEFATLKVTGPENLFPLSDVTFRVPELNATSYIWSFPEDATNIDPLENTASATWGCQEGYVRVTAANTCGAASDSIFVNIEAPSLSGPSTVSENSMGVIYTVDEVPASSFSWAVPADATITDGQGTDSIFVDFGLEAGNVTVEISNNCYTNVLELPIRITDTILLADYESVSLTFEVFSNTTFNEAANPDPDKVNSSENVGETFKSEVPWAGIYADLGYNMDMTRHKKFHVKVLGPKTGEVLLKLEDIDVGTEQFTEVLASYTTLGDWQLLEYIFPDAKTEVYDRITLFFDFGSETENTFWFDDITLLPYEDTVTASLASTFSTVQIYPNPAGEVLHYTLSISGPHKAVISDMQGRVVLEKMIPAGTGSVNISSLTKGTYFITFSTNTVTERKLFIRQ